MYANMRKATFVPKNLLHGHLDLASTACQLLVQVRQHPKLLRQVLALDKLVAATVKALSSASATSVQSSS